MVRLVLIVLLTIMTLFPVSSFAGQAAGDVNVTKRNLGDINSDGKDEFAIEKKAWGASSCSEDVEIQSGGKIILTLPSFSGDTADGYKVVGNQIVVWFGNWNHGSKWDPHVYDFRWYQWNKKIGKFVIEKEGFTKKAYSYKQATKIIPTLVKKSNKSIIWSKKATFIEDAVVLAVKKFGKGLQVRSIREENSVWISDLYPNCIHYFYVSLGSEKRSVLVGVMLLSDGSYTLDATT